MGLARSSSAASAVMFTPTILPVCTEASLLVAETAGSVKLLTSFRSGMNAFCAFMISNL